MGQAFLRVFFFSQHGKPDRGNLTDKNVCLTLLLVHSSNESPKEIPAEVAFADVDTWRADARDGGAECDSG